MNALWCLWFASSIAMPFFLGFSEAAGTVAYAGSYGFAALGILVGLWLSSCPTVQKYQVEHNKLPLCLLVLGLVITLALWPAEIARFFLLEGANLPAWLLHANAVLVPMEKPLSFLNAMLCGLTAHISTQEQGRAHCRREVAAAILGFVAGLTRGWAWTLLLPCPAFPIPAVNYRLSTEDLWANGLPVPIGACLTFTCMLIWARLAHRLQERYDANFFPHVIGTLCLGELAWRFVSRICPSLLQISMPGAIAALAVQAACLTTIWALTRASRPEPSRNCGKQNGNAIGLDEPNPLPANLVDAFSSHGLTKKEVAVLTATLRGLTSAEAAAQLGISASTIRTYRARACDKLNISNTGELMTGIMQRQEAPKSAGMSKSNQLQRTLGTAGGVGLMLLILMPPSATATCWECTWLIPFGIALGLIACTAWPTLKDMRVKPHSIGTIAQSRPARVAVVAVATTALQCGYAMLAQSEPYAPQPTFLRACIVGAVAICTSIGVEHTLHAKLTVQPGNKVAPYAIAGAVALAAWGSFGGIWWHISVTACAALVCPGIMSQRKGAASGNPAPHAAASPIVVLNVAALAFIWEETLRGVSYASLQYCGTVFLAASLCVVALHLLKNPLLDFPCSAAVVLALCAIIFACTKTPFLSLLVAVTVLNPFVGATENAYPQTLLSPWHSPCAVVAFSLCTAVYMANAWGSSVANGDRNTAFITALSVLFSLLGAVALASAARSCKQDPPYGSIHSTESLATALQTYGLTPLQLNVALCVARGHSIGQIARELSYSRSRVHQVLKEVYTTLNLRNHAQLAAFLTQIDSSK